MITLLLYEFWHANGEKEAELQIEFKMQVRNDFIQQHNDFFIIIILFCSLFHS